MKIMNTEELLQSVTERCETCRADLNGFTSALQNFTRRLEQILSQLHKGINVRDEAFAGEFNQFCLDMRADIDREELFWNEARNQARTRKPADFDASLALAAKGFNSKAKTLSRACDEFSTAYHAFYKMYQSYTAHKLNVWLLTSCDADINNITGKILFLAREITKHTERNRGS